MLRELKLVNYCCHADLEVKFQPGINCIVGSNGKGKSSILDGLYAALTNVHMHPDGAKGAIRQGTDTAILTAVFDDFTVSRSVNEIKNRHQLILSNGEKYIQAKDIENQLASRFNLVKAILDKFVFIRQGRFTEIVSLPESERAKMLAYLSNVEYFETLWKKLADEMKGHELAAKSGPTFDEHTIKAKIEELTKQIAEEKAKAAEVNKELVELQKTDYQAKLERLREVHQAKERQDNAQEELKKLMVKFTSLDGERRACIEQYDEKEALHAKVALGSTDAEMLQGYRKYQQRAEEIYELTEQKAQLEKEITGYQSTYDTHGEVVAQMDAKIGELSEELARIKIQVSQATNSKKGVKCDVCGALPEHQYKGDPKILANKQRKVASDLAELRAQYRELGSAVAQHDRRVTQLAKIIEKLTTFDIGDYVSNADLYTGLQERYDQQVKLTAEMARIKTVLMTATSNLEHVKSSMDYFDKEVATTKSLLDAEKTITKGAKEAQKTADRINELRILAATTDTAKRSAEEHLTSLKDLLKQISQKKKQKKLIEYVELLDEVRTLAHRSNIPHVVSKRFLHRLIVQVNSYLEQFEAPFRAHIGDDLGFRAEMSYGAMVNGQALSGGQKCMLSLAFWLSVFQANAGRTGLLVLDEPGAELDAGARKIFNQTLQRVDEELKFRGQTMLLISHDAALTHLFHTIPLS